LGLGNGSQLWLQPALTDNDKNYITGVFWAERWSCWDRLLRPWLPSALIPPLGLLLALWAVRALVVIVKDKTS
jgi:hypothetical protein